MNRGEFIRINQKINIFIALAGLGLRVKVKHKIEMVLKIRKAVLNWASVIFSILCNRNANIIFRDGFKIQNVKNPMALIELKDYGYSINLEQNDIVVASKDGNEFLCRVSSGYDLGHIIEIFEQRVYDGNYADNVVIDIGVSNGDSAIFFARRGARLVLGLSQ